MYLILTKKFINVKSLSLVSLPSYSSSSFSTLTTTNYPKIKPLPPRLQSVERLLFPSSTTTTSKTLHQQIPNKNPKKPNQNQNILIDICSHHSLLPIHLSQTTSKNNNTYYSKFYGVDISKEATLDASVFLDNIPLCYMTEKEKMNVGVFTMNLI